MITQKFTDREIFKQLNVGMANWGDLEGDVVSVKTLHGDYFEKINELFDEEAFKEELEGSGGILEVATETRTLGVDDLRKFDVGWDTWDHSEFFVQLLGPFTEGEWEIKDIFNLERRYLLDELMRRVYDTTITFIKESPGILSENGGFTNIEGTAYYIKEGDRFRKISEEEVAKISKDEEDQAKRKQEVERSMRDRILNKLTEEERNILGVPVQRD